MIEKQRTATPFGWVAAFVSGQDGPCGSGLEAHTDPPEIGESHPAEFHFHGVFDTGSGGNQTVRSR